VKKAGTDENSLKLNNQYPSVDAYKLSPKEVGILVHERFDASRVKNLEAGGVPVPNPTFAEYDGVKYFVVSTDGANAENLQGWKTTYDYDTKWPYAWMEGNSLNNYLPVNLNVDKLHKLDAWMKFKTTAFDEPLVGEVGGDPLVGANPDTDIEYSKAYIEGEGSVSFASSNKDVVTVDPSSGELTVVGPGTATITISGTATYYRNAPKSISYQVVIASGGKEQTVEVVQLNEYAIFDPKVYEIGPEGSGVDMSFETNIERGTLLLSYMKYDWIKMPEEKAKTRVDGWKGKVKTITILPNDTPVERSAPFMLGIYDDNKEFMPLDTAWVRQKPMAVADNP
jgi:hypothetical protein